jgi:hypothetical protein
VWWCLFAISAKSGGIGGWQPRLAWAKKKKKEEIISEIIREKRAGG